MIRKDMNQTLCKLLIVAFSQMTAMNGIVYGSSIEVDSTFTKAFRKNIGGWVAADATYSIALPDGRILWLFGDTFFGSINPDGSINSGDKLLRNTGVLQEGDSLTTLYGGTPSNPQNFILTDRPDSTWYWPEHGIVENDTLYIFISKFKYAPGPPGFNFASDGNDIACFTYPDLKFSRIITLPFYQLNGVYYGNQLLKDSGYTYIYGRKDEVGIPYPHVARVKNGELTGAWEFWDGWVWQSDPSNSRKINNFQVSQQYSVTRHSNKYILITQDIWLSSDIWSFTSVSPTGPWKNKTKIYVTPKLAASSMTYNAWAHPEFDIDGRLLISYNNNADFGELLKNAELYRPTFIRVPYSMLDTSFNTSSLKEQKEYTNGIDFHFYPNPCINQMQIEFFVFCDGAVDLMLLDSSGREIRKLVAEYLRIGTHVLNMDFSDLDPGIYFFRYRNANNSIARAFIKSG
jgi:hypothetical protein